MMAIIRRLTLACHDGKFRSCSDKISIILFSYRKQVTVLVNILRADLNMDAVKQYNKYLLSFLRHIKMLTANIRAIFEIT